MNTITQVASKDSTLSVDRVRMAHTEWLIVLYLDEFIVPSEPFKDNLVSFAPGPLRVDPMYGD